MGFSAFRPSVVGASPHQHEVSRSHPPILIPPFQYIALTNSLLLLDVHSTPHRMCRCIGKVRALWAQDIEEMAPEPLGVKAAQGRSPRPFTRSATEFRRASHRFLKNLDAFSSRKVLLWTDQKRSSRYMRSAHEAYETPRC